MEDVGACRWWKNRSCRGCWLAHHDAGHGGAHAQTMDVVVVEGVDAAAVALAAHVEHGILDAVGVPATNAPQQVLPDDSKSLT